MILFIIVLMTLQQSSSQHIHLINLMHYCRTVSTQASTLLHVTTVNRRHHRPIKFRELLTRVHYRFTNSLYPYYNPPLSLRHDLPVVVYTDTHTSRTSPQILRTVVDALIGDCHKLYVLEGMMLHGIWTATFVS